MTYTAKVDLIGVSPYTQSFQHNTPKLPKELADAYEERTWRNKVHRNSEGLVVMPAMGFKNAIAEAAKYLSIQIPGKGKSTYTKHFESGILVQEDPIIYLRDGNDYKPIHVDNVPRMAMNVPSDGVSGSGKRVQKFFPVFAMGWKATVNYLVMDDLISHEVFLDHLVQAGQLIGIGSFRVRNKGTFGRFRVSGMEWNEYEAKKDNIRLVINGKEVKVA